MFHILTAVALAVQPAPATQATPPAPSTSAQQAIGTAAQAFSNCIRTGVAAAPATGTPEAAASGIMATCRTQQTALETAVNGAISGLPAEQQAAARQQMQTDVAAIPAQLADAIRQRRAAATAPAATPPAPPAPAPRGR